VQDPGRGVECGARETRWGGEVWLDVMERARNIIA
jgi:hypothetical protein